MGRESSYAESVQERKIVLVTQGVGGAIQATIQGAMQGAMQGAIQGTMQGAMQGAIQGTMQGAMQGVGEVMDGVAYNMAKVLLSAAEVPPSASAAFRLAFALVMVLDSIPHLRII